MSIPQSTEPASPTPKVRATELINKACRTTAGISGGAALVPGPLGLLTILPDMYAIWRVQSQLVADIAAVHGKLGALTKEQMIWCLFKHSAAHVAGDFVVQVGERYIVHPRSLQWMQKAVGFLGIKIAQRVLGKSLARYLPLLGAAAVARYAYMDTKKVGLAAEALFSKEIVFEPDPA
ncbi:MAG: hypothetical protein KBF66_18205 [Rhodoferax sp.]|nr:hypothetical protein [Rhodoferax sp.]